MELSRRLRSGWFCVYEGKLATGDILTYTFEQKRIFTATHNPHSIAGYQKVYYGPLLLGQIPKKKCTSPNPELIWDTDKHCAQSRGGDHSLSDQRYY